MADQGGYGAIFKITVFSAQTAVANILDFEFPEFRKVMADVTAHDATSGYGEHIATGKRMMESFTLNLLWDRNQDTHHALVQAFDSDTTSTMSVQDPDGIEEISFSGHVISLGRVAEQDDGLRCDVEIQPTGAPTISYTSA